MPPPKSGKELKPGQKGHSQQWILAGAPWERHWAFIKPERPAVPDPATLRAAAAGFQVRNPIDAFVLAKLRTHGLSPAGGGPPRARAGSRSI